MELLFIDESEQVKKDNKSHFTLLGTVVSCDNLIPLEKYLSNFREKYKFSNLKSLRTSRSITKEQRLIISKELYDGLEGYNITLLSSIIGKYSMNNYSKLTNYFDALTFIIERFFFYLHDNDKVGMIILDSNCNEIAKKLTKKAYDYILETRKREGYIKKRLYAPILFCDDDVSHIIQLSDLCVAGLQKSAWDMLNALTNSNELKGKEDSLVQHGLFLPMYWKYFMKKNGKVSGSGIKYWN